MKALIINLAGETTRMDFQRRQMDSLGLDYERLEAVTPKTLCSPANDPFWTLWERPLRPGEKALFASHQKAWETVVRDDAPRLILEDDALLSTETPAFLAQAEAFGKAERICLEVRGRKKLVSRRLSAVHPRIRRLYQDRTGAAAYVLWPSGASKLLARGRRHPGLSDAVMSHAYEVHSYQADPALAVQLDQCAAYGIGQVLETQSSLSSAPIPRRADFSLRQRWLFRWRRVGAQIRMGRRGLCCLWSASWREIPLNRSRW